MTFSNASLSLFIFLVCVKIAEIYSESDRAANRNEDHVRHLVQLVCPEIMQQIRAHQFQWDPTMRMNAKRLQLALKTGKTNTQDP